MHIVYHLKTGGLENGLVNLINQTPAGRFRHAVICMKELGEFALKINQTPVYCLHKQEGHDFALYFRLYSLLKRLKPDIVHTRNLATLECQIPAWLAGVSHRVHGEHGWDSFDPFGLNLKHQRLRRLVKPWVHRYIALSRQIEEYLTDKVHVDAQKIARICNGVNTRVFYPRRGQKPSIKRCPFSPDHFLIGSVGRMQGVKDQMNLVKAFLNLLKIKPEARQKARLVLIGEGPLRQQAWSALHSEGLDDWAWLPGDRNDIAEILRGLDLFVLSSQAEGISNALLEAMASALPVIATDVGGNSELVIEGETGRLVGVSDPEAMADALIAYFENPRQMKAHGLAGLARAQEHFCLNDMIGRYFAVYDEMLQTG